MQAKIEPGNLNLVQISPTLQATKSNYTQIHKGTQPRYLNYFLNDSDRVILLDQLQSEQGARFLKKRNRNIIIQIQKDIELHDDFRWMTLGQIKKLMQFDNTVNMDTRTVISGISYGSQSTATVEFYNHVNSFPNSINCKFLSSEINSETSYFSFDYIIHWFTTLKSKYEITIQSIPLKDVKLWRIGDSGIDHVEEKFFKIIAVDVQICGREVANWHQPIIEPVQQGICAFVTKEIMGLMHFLVQAKLEAGNFDILEMAPTVQCVTGSYLNNGSRETLPYLDYILSASGESVFYDTLQSEEGGRFFREQNRNLIVIAKDDFSLETPENYTWMTLNQIKSFIKFNNYFNIQARSLISSITI
jgi:oxidase EvaA